MHHSRYFGYSPPSCVGAGVSYVVDTDVVVSVTVDAAVVTTAVDEVVEDEL